MAVAELLPPTAWQRLNNDQFFLTGGGVGDLQIGNHLNTTIPGDYGLRYRIPKATITTGDRHIGEATLTIFHAGTSSNWLTSITAAPGPEFEAGVYECKEVIAAGALLATPVTWDNQDGTGVNPHVSPSFHTVFDAAVQDAIGDPDGDPGDGYLYVNVVLIANNTIIQSGRADTENGVEKPTLEFALVPQVDATATHDDIDITTSWDNFGIPFSVEYDHDAAGQTLSTRDTNRKYDHYHRMTPAPASGRKVITYVHGGFWYGGGKALNAGNENYLSPELLDLCLSLDYSLMSIEYQGLQIPTAVDTFALPRSFPMPVADIMACLADIVENAATLEIDPDRMVISGHSAGGHLSGFAAFAAASNDSTVYSSVQTNANGGRAEDYPYAKGGIVEYDFDAGGEIDLTEINIGGIMFWDSPIDVIQCCVGVSDPQQTINFAARTNLHGATTSYGHPSQDHGADLNHYLTGTGYSAGPTVTNTYDTAIDEADLPAIFYMRATGSGIIPSSGGVTALYDALDTIGYDVSADVGTIYEGRGLTRIERATTHGSALLLQDLTPEGEWLESLFDEGSPQTVEAGFLTGTPAFYEPLAMADAEAPFLSGTPELYTPVASTEGPQTEEAPFFTGAAELYVPTAITVTAPEDTAPFLSGTAELYVPTADVGAALGDTAPFFSGTAEFYAPVATIVVVPTMPFFAGTPEFYAPEVTGIPAVVGNVRSVRLRTYIRKRNRMDTIELDDTTEEYIEVVFVSREDPTGLTVQFGITAVGNDAPDTWTAGEWADDSPSIRGEKYFSTALALVGGSGIDLEEGTFQMWMRVLGSTDTPVKKAGTLVVS